MKKFICAGFLSLLIPLVQAAVTQKDLENDAKTPDNVLTQGLGYDLKRYSPLNKINRENVKRLVPVWNYGMDDDRGQEAQPLVVDRVMYVTDHKSTVAINAATGRQLWKHTIQYPPETPRIVCCGILNRGAAVYGDKLYRTTLDASVIALDIKTGEEVWRANAIDWKRGYSMTMAPLVVNGVVVTGVSGAEYGARGFIDGWDAETGRQVWRTYTVPGPGDKGNETWIEDQWAYGGGSVWLIGSYDPELDLMYWGIGNPSSWNVLRRKGDNLYTCSVIAMRPKTGEIVWHYQ
jgi:alcohol dehydrogenase (cytochrome c)